MLEIWKPVHGYEGLYEVSNTGRVRGLIGNRRVRPGHVLKPRKHKLGYLDVGLVLDRNQKRKLVHRLVARAFLQGSDHSLEINHKDGDKSNNCVLNLEYVTRSENILHAYRVLGQRPNIGPARLALKMKYTLYIETIGCAGNHVTVTKNSTRRLLRFARRGGDCSNEWLRWFIKRDADGVELARWDNPAVAS